VRILGAEPTISTRTARTRAAVLAVPFVLAAVHMAVFDRGLGGDGWAPFAFLDSLVEDGDLTLENNTRGVLNGLVPGPGGHLVMQYPPGVALVDLVPYLTGRELDRLLPGRWLAAGAVVPPVGRVSRRVFLEIAAIVLASNLEVLAGLLAILVALRRIGFADGVAAAATALTFFAGPLLFYSLVGASHAPTFALAALLLLGLVRRDGSLDARGAVAAGLVVGCATLVRYSSAALLAAVLAATWARPPARRWLAAIGGFLAPLVLLPIYWRLHYGQWAPVGYGGTLRPTLASPWNVLFSGHHGLFLFHPALLLAAAGLLIGGLAKARGGDGRLWRIGAVWFLAVAIVHGWWSEWANTGGYGQRFLIDALPALAIGFAGLLAAVRRRAILASALAATVLLGYLLFFAAVAGLARPAGGAPWPQTLADYGPLVRHPPSLKALGRGLLRASFALRALRHEALAVPAPRGADRGRLFF
jgi:hypothetical protein